MRLRLARWLVVVGGVIFAAGCTLGGARLRGAVLEWARNLPED